MICGIAKILKNDFRRKESSYHSKHIKAGK